MTERCPASAEIAPPGALQGPHGRASDAYLSMLKVLDTVEFCF
jgi:hypothetical protein